MVGEFGVLGIPQGTKFIRSTKIPGYRVPFPIIASRLGHIMQLTIHSFEKAFNALPQNKLTYADSSIMVDTLAIQSKDERISLFCPEHHTEPMYQSGPVIPSN